MIHRGRLGVDAKDGLAVFSYAHVPRIKPAQKILEDKVPPIPESKLDVLKLVIERLTANDHYVYIGMDHFAALIRIPPTLGAGLVQPVPEKQRCRPPLPPSAPGLWADL